LHGRTGVVSESMSIHSNNPVDMAVSLMMACHGAQSVAQSSMIEVASTGFPMVGLKETVASRRENRTGSFDRSVSKRAKGG
jgi:hypothetical protein